MESDCHILLLLQEPIVSPVPLPPDVVCIDPVDDETLAYFPEFVRYLRHRETEVAVFPRIDSCSLLYVRQGLTVGRLTKQSLSFLQWIHRKKDIVGTRMDVEANRALLMNWLLEVALHFRVSQVCASSSHLIL